VDLEALKAKALQQRKANKKLLAKLKKQKNQRQVDAQIHDLHDEAFSHIDCLECANCCKTTGPLFTDKDIQRISAKMKMKEVDFIAQYLRVDEDNDHVLKTVPCVFLGEDNYCSIYDYRPKACREFPHTNRVKQSQIFNLTLKNAEVCPAVFEILVRLKAVS